VVEDNGVNQQVAREILEGRGVRADVAAGGREALAMLEQARYDLVLMDVQMPDMDGYETTRHIRENPRYGFIPIVALTAHAMKEEREKCLAAGMNEQLTKPLEPDTLFAVLGRWIKTAPPPPPAEVAGDGILPGIDLLDALRRLSGNQDILFELLREFRERWADALPRLRAALAQPDLDQVALLAHTLRTEAASLSMGEVALRAEAIENAESDQVGDAIDGLEGPLRGVLEGLASIPARL
jgi:CheY-like chemotaxis protein/HPt (histidine-containing phosphotransfer) domain-containing protein